MKLNRIILTVFLLLYTGTAWSQECLVTTLSVEFGNYDTSSGAPRDAIGKVGVTCDDTLPFTVKLGQGKKSRRSFQPRVLEGKAGGDIIHFNLYRDSARQEIWGDGTGNTFVVTGTGTGREIIFTVYGRISARQNVSAGNYSDVISVIVEW